MLCSLPHIRLLRWLACGWVLSLVHPGRDATSKPNVSLGGHCRKTTAGVVYDN